uniref:NACHT domain-containing protein n=2 Tax=Cyprinus carpio TaxID=7962 RepID=A0A8C1M871_CYPCA
MVTHNQNSCSAFNPSKVHTHSSEHISGAVGSHLCCGARGAVGGLVPCSRAPQSWYCRPETRTHNLRVRSQTIKPLGHDFPKCIISDLLYCVFYYLQFHSDKSNQREPSSVSMKSDMSMERPEKLEDRHKSTHLSQKTNSPGSSCVSMKSDQSVDTSKTFKGRHTSTDLSTFRSNLVKKFECLYEGTSKQGNTTLLNEIYTELYITESESGEINNEHEVTQIEIHSRRAATEETPITCNEIFRPLPGQDKAIRTVLTKGVAGIGKTVSAQKFILEWAEGKENQDVQLIFPLPFREINLMKDKTLSLSDLLHDFYPETKEMDISSDEYKVLFIFDGLDECRLSLDFKSKVKLCKISESVSVDVLLKNLIVGNLLPSALIWITSRPAAADLVPSECVHRVTEVRGFNDPQKEEYFRKRISDQSLADRIISHLKSSRSLYIMCHIPVFCCLFFRIVTWKNKNVFGLHQRAVDEALQSKNGHLDLFLRFLLGLSLKFSQTLLRELLTQTGNCSYKKEETVEYIKEKIIQNSFTERSINLFHCLNELGDDSLMQEIQDYLKFGKIRETKLSSSQWSALVYVLLTSEQKLDDFVLKNFTGSQNTADEVLQKLLPVIKECRSAQLYDCGVTDKGCAALAPALRSIPSHLRELNMSLNELGDSGVNLLSDLLKDPHCKLETLQLNHCGVTHEGCAALASALRSNSTHLRQLNLSRNKLQDSGLKLLSDGLKDPLCILEKLRLWDCGVTDEGCAALASALRSNPSHLRELDLNYNKLGDSGLKLLSEALKDPRCKLETLWLNDCGVTDDGCAALTSALRSNPSHLRELNLSENKLGDSAVKLLSDMKKDPQYGLQRFLF